MEKTATAALGPMAVLLTGALPAQTETIPASASRFGR